MTTLRLIEKLRSSDPYSSPLPSFNSNSEKISALINALDWTHFASSTVTLIPFGDMNQVDCSLKQIIIAEFFKEYDLTCIYLICMLFSNCDKILTFSNRATKAYCWSKNPSPRPDWSTLRRSTIVHKIYKYLKFLFCKKIWVKNDELIKKYWYPP